MAKISETVRGYFIRRIQNTLDDQINTLRTKSAGKKEKIVKEKLSSYLKEIGVDKTLKEYRKIYAKSNDLENELKNVLKNIGADTIGYNTIPPDEIERRFKNKLHEDIESYFIDTTKEGKAISYLLTKRTEAVDRMYLVTDHNQIEGTLGEALEGTDARLLNGH